MIKEILLVFMINADGDVKISDRIFESVEECATFVNTLAQISVVEPNGSFRFIVSDGTLFEGQCVNKLAYHLQKGTQT